MRAAVFTAFDGPESVAVQEWDEPTPGTGEAVVRVEASSINHHDLWILEGSGAIGSDEPPFLSGVDVAGVVDAVGPDVESVEPGDRVVLCPLQTCGECRFCREGPENACTEFSLYHGGFAERALVDADRLLHLPDGVDFSTAAALPVAYVTAWHMLRRADATAGDLVFVPGATGGVGIAAIQLVDVLGGRSIGTTSSAEKRRRLEDLAVDHVIESDDVAEIREAVESIGEPDVVVNHLGGPFTDLGLSVLRRGGTMVACGGSAGGTSEIDVRSLYLEHKRLLGSTMGTQPDLERLVSLVDAGEFEPVIGGEYSLEEVGDAFRDMQTRELFGKAIVRP